MEGETQIVKAGLDLNTPHVLNAMLPHSPTLGSENSTWSEFHIPSQTYTYFRKGRGEKEGEGFLERKK